MLPGQSPPTGTHSQSVAEPQHKSASTLQSKRHFEHTAPPHTVPHSPFINDAICPDLETFCTGCHHIKMSRDRLSKIMSHNFSKINYDESGHFCEFLRSTVQIFNTQTLIWASPFFFTDSPILGVYWVMSVPGDNSTN